MPTEKRERKRQGRQVRQEYLQAQRRKAKLRRQAVVVVVVVALVLGATLLFSQGGDDESADSTTTTSAAGPPKGAPVPAGAKLDTWECPKPDGSSPRTDTFPGEPPPMCIDPAKTYVAKLDTSEGPVEITLDTQKTPNTANNYVVLSRYGYYNGTVITRIDESIDILQTGSPKTQTIADPGPGYNIKDEGTGFQYADGDVVMARSQGPDSGSAQYFLVVGPKAAQLNSQGNYVTFGKVTKGLDVLKAVAGLFEPCPPDDQACLGGAPSRLVTINKIEIVES